MTTELRVKEFINQGLRITTAQLSDDIKSIKTKMLVNDFSQIPIIDNSEQLIGCISWKSIGKQESLGKISAKAKDYIESSVVVEESDSFLDHIKAIAKHEYILVVDKKRKLKGILTTFDMTMYFYDFINPYLRIGIIEDCIRKLIKSANIELKKEITEHTFYEYQKLLDQPANWKKLNLNNLDKDIFIDKIDEIRKLRNRIAHYKPNKITPSENFLINSFASLIDRASAHNNV